MKTLYIERSTGECRDGKWVETLDLDGVERIVVGTGPGSFAGIRSALAFAQGYALGRKCEVLGLPSACAIAAQIFEAEDVSSRTVAASATGTGQRVGRYRAGRRGGDGTEDCLAVIGDARQGKAWIALFNGYRLEKDVFQVNQQELAGSVPGAYKVVTPDAKRLDVFLRETFGDRYLGGQTPTSEGLRRFAEANPSVLKAEPLPIYLNPAVRPNPACV